MTQMTRRTLLAAAAAAVPFAGRSQAGSYTRPIRLIVPFPAGSTPDTLGRALAPHFANALGQPVVVENRAGAAGRIGTEAIAHATDGHTIGLSYNGAIATARALVPNLGYDPRRDLAPVALVARTPQVLVVAAQVPARDVAQFVAHARANPGRMSFASVGSGSASHLAMEEFKFRTETDLVHVPYRGFPPAVVDMLGGRIEAAFCPVAAVLPHIQAGKIHALAVSGEARMPQLTQVPTLAEAGIANAVSFGWNGLFAPAATPRAAIEQLAAETRKALADAETRDRLDRAGFEVAWLGPAEFASFIDIETERWSGLIARLGIKADD